MSEWTYNNKPFDSDMIEDYIGFVYEVYDTEAKMKNAHLQVDINNLERVIRERLDI